MKRLKRLKRIFFMRMANILPINGYLRSHFIRFGGVNVEKGCWIGKYVQFDTVHPEFITIEKGVVITTGTIILTHYLDPRKKGIDWRNGKVHIKRGAFIGCNSVICNSCTIGENAIIGAGSIVTKDIPANQVWAGNPARYIKDRLSD